jgi:hypothetical protein
MENFEKEIDYNELSLFATPMGRIVQKEYLSTFLAKRDAQTERELYIAKVNESLTSISQSFWDIDLTIKLIQFADPKIKSFKMTRVDRGEYLKYHFENYFFRLPKLKDQVLNLLNVVYKLDYLQSNSLERKIRGTKKLEQKNLLSFVDFFDKVFVEIKPLRDTIAHRGDVTDKNIALITAYEIIEEEHDKTHYTSLLNGQIVLHTFVFKKNQGILKQAIIALLLVLYDDFSEILKQ